MAVKSAQDMSSIAKAGAAAKPATRERQDRPDHSVSCRLLPLVRCHPIRSRRAAKLRAGPARKGDPALRPASPRTSSASRARSGSCRPSASRLVDGVEQVVGVRPLRPDGAGDDLGLRLEAEPAAVLRRARGSRRRRAPRPPSPSVELDRQARLVVGVGDELALPQVGERRRRRRSGATLVGDADAAPAAVVAVERQHQAGRLGRAAVDDRAHAEGAPVAAERRHPPVVEVEARLPDQRAVAEDPEAPATLDPSSAISAVPARAPALIPPGRRRGRTCAHSWQS